MSAFTPGIHLPLFSKSLKDCLSAEWCLFIILNGGLEHVLPKTVQLIIATSSRRYPSSLALFIALLCVLATTTLPSWLIAIEKHPIFVFVAMDFTPKK